MKHEKRIENVFDQLFLRTQNVCNNNIEAFELKDDDDNPLNYELGIKENMNLFFFCNI